MTQQFSGKMDPRTRVAWEARLPSEFGPLLESYRPFLSEGNFLRLGVSLAGVFERGFKDGYDARNLEEIK